MKIFIDSSNIEEIETINNLGILDGITTNPSLIAKEKPDNLYTHYQNILEINSKPLSVSIEVLSSDYDDMINEAHQIYENLFYDLNEGVTYKEIKNRINSKINDHIDKNYPVIKLPLTKDGIQATSKLKSEGFLVNCTLVFSVSQAILAAKAGADYVSPFIGRIDDINYDGIQLIKDIKEAYSNYNFNTEILAASVRNINHISDCAKAGSDIITAPYDVINKMFQHPLTDKGIEKFMNDYNSSIKK